MLGRRPDLLDIHAEAFGQILHARFGLRVGHPRQENSLIPIEQWSRRRRAFGGCLDSRSACVMRADLWATHQRRVHLRSARTIDFARLDAWRLLAVAGA